MAPPTCSRCGARLDAQAGSCSSCDALVPVPARRPGFLARYGLAGVAAVLLALAVPVYGFVVCADFLSDVTARVRCGANLKQIGLACSHYQEAHEGSLPEFAGREFFEALYDGDFLGDPRVFICTRSSERPGEPGEPLRGLSYETWKSGSISNEDLERHGERIPLAWDRTGNHLDDDRNVLYGDGRILESSIDDFEGLLELAGAMYELGR